jgi:hypothetical protein
MSTVRLTEERLRTWALAQEERERMCLGILSLDPRYSNVKPRRPKGGPDGGRDIEAVFSDRLLVWGGVGFRNNAVDSAEDKRWAREKFKSDSSSARMEAPELQGFVFFTNVDLTPSEVADFEAIARSHGFQHIEVFYRERIRIILDSPRGLALRFQHLGVSLSEAEQTAFFAEYGTQLESILHRGFSQVEERLKRLEFFHDSSLQLDCIELFVELKEDYSPLELGHFRVLAEFIDLHELEPHPTLWLACRDAYPKYVSNGTEVPLIGTKSLSWSRHPDENLQATVFSASQLTTRSLNAGVGIHRRGPFHTLSDLDRKSLSIYITENLLDKIAAIYVSANEYWLAGVPSEMFVPLDVPPLAAWPEPLSDLEANQQWKSILVKMENPPEWIPAELAREGWGVDFRGTMPIKKEGQR